ncbi:MAG: magnesium transporter MgtE N-terminal domain-containing protein, partial [Flavobacteriales bacterium]
MQLELTKEYIDRLKEAIKNGEDSFIMEKVKELHSADLAEVIVNLHKEESKYLYKLLNPDTAADALMEMKPEIRNTFLSTFTSTEIANNILVNVDSDDDLVNELSPEKQEEVITQLKDHDQVSHIVDLMTYEEGSAGSLMAKELIIVHDNWSVSKSIREMRRQAENVENVYNVYVVDDYGHLIGALSIKD